MKFVRTVTLLLLLLGIVSAAQDLPQIEAVWQQTIDALSRGDHQQAKNLFADFNQKVRAYVRAKGLSWQIEYLTGSLDCQFPESRASGAQLLSDILQNGRGLNDAGERELQRQIAACTAPDPAATPRRETRPDLPRNVADASAHFQSPGIRASMKGGYRFVADNESAVSISPIPASELMARRVPLSEPQKALAEALGRLPAGSTGAVVQEFAVTTANPDRSTAIGIGKCLQAYTPALRGQFQIKPSTYMVTIYTADSARQVYEYASRLHGLQLPRGVVAYSVPEDMSLAAVGGPDACGSMAHELVHLLIKSSFPVSPAWLEEGIASEVAVATPEANHFKLSWSWRDDMLKQEFSSRPNVAALLESPWTSFSTDEHGSMARVAAVQAMSAVFIRYLDSKGLLSEIYFAVRDHHLSPDLSQYKSYREIVEEKLGRNVNQIDADFAEWFQKQESSRPGFSRNSGAAPESNAPAIPCDVSNMPAQQAHPDCEPAMNQRAPDLPAMNQKAPDPPVEPR